MVNRFGSGSFAAIARGPVSVNPETNACDLARSTA
jgi:hypothetical protein